MLPTPTRPHAALGPSRRTALRFALLVVAAFAVVAPTRGWAGGALPFSDVGTGHPFFEEIRWLEGHNVAEGFPDGTFRPGDAVTRQAMAAYLERFSGLLPTVTTSYRTTQSSTTTLTPVPIPDVSATIQVPDGLEARVVARFAAESRCSGGGSTAWCTVRLLVDGVEMDPAVGGDLAFDSVAASAHDTDILERTAVVGPGIHTVTAQFNVSSAGTTFTLDDMTLVVETFPIV